ncbi:GlsB/YeaQ/YmgE family stress response membrane protein [Micromonosporaceae bacterium Da 78-11]
MKEPDVHVSGIITAIVIGLIIGALGRLVVPGKQNIPIWLTMLIGIVAAIIGTFIASALGVNDTKGIDWIELLIQVVLAAVGVAAVAGIYGRRRA